MNNRSQTLSRKFLSLIAVVLWLTFAAMQSSAQVAGTASLNGTVTDPSRAVISSADVTATLQSTGVVRTAKTNTQGAFTLTQLQPGVYQVQIKKSGFKTTIRPNVELLVGSTVTLDVDMQVGQLAQEVVVEATAVPLNTVDASLGNPLSGDLVRSLPSLDLNPAGLLSLQAGVAYIPAQSDTQGGYGGTTDFDGRSGAVNGARSDQTNITLDGVDCNDPITGYAFTCVMRATQVSLAEFRTTTANYTSEAGGRSSSAQVQLLTTHGTNALHGSAYYTHRNEAFNANDFFLNKAGIPEPKFRRHIYGAALGGPVLKDRAYLWGNWERMTESLFQSAVRTVPTLHFRDGVFIYPCKNSAGFANCPTSPTSVTGVSGQSYSVPAGSFGLSPAQIAAIDPLGIGPNAALLSYWADYPTDINDFSVGDGINVAGHRFASPVNNEFNTYIARADYNIDHGGNHRLYWRGTYVDDTIHNEAQFEGQPSIRTTKIGNRGFALGYTAVLTPNVVNNFRWGLTRIKSEAVGNIDGEYVNVRFVDELHGFDHGPVAGYPDLATTKNRRTPTNQLRDDVSWNRGNHSFGFGGDVRFVRNLKAGNGLSFHGFTINPSWLGDGGRSIEPGQANCSQPGCTAVPANDTDAYTRFHDFLTLMLGPITQVDASYNFDKTGTTLPEGDLVNRKFAANEYEMYFQDQWKVKPSLTLTLGLRYGLSTPPWEQNGNEVVPTPNFGSWFNCRGNAMTAGVPSSDCGLIQTNLGGPENNGRNYYDWDYNNWSPRVAVAWSPRGTEGFLGRWFGGSKFVVRGGYSLVYDRMGMALVNTFDEQGSFGLSTAITSLFGGCDIGGANPCTRFSGPFATEPAKSTIMSDGGTQLVPSPGASFPATPPTGLLTVSSGLDSNIRNPYAHVFDISVSRELPWKMAVEAAYVGRRGRKLPLLRDYSMPANYCEPISGVCSFDAANQLIALSAAGQDINTLAPIPFWENLFPGFGPSGVNGGCLQFQVLGTGCGFSATQVAYDYMIGYHGNTATGPGFGASTFWQDVDYFQFPSFATCSTGTDLDGDGFRDCPFLFFPGQYVNLLTWATIARSEYHAMQLMLRKQTSNGLSFTFNYTLSKSLDHSSTPERQSPGDGGFFTGGYTGAAINSWEIDREYSFSDFDSRHQFNTYWTAELPFGRGKKFAGGATGLLDNIVGGWMLSGIMRFSTGVPANVINGRSWPTNWNLQGNATCAPVGAPLLGLDNAPCPSTQNEHFASHGGGPGTPNIFANPDEAIQHFRFSAVGERGQRNVLRADGYFNTDLGIGKTFNVTERQKVLFRWEIFNLTNSAYFDAVSLSLNPGDSATFGDYTQMANAPRRMQFSLRYEF
jgi:Carboxypeptidase regulatory-like domain/TonB dependent receptor-like, beta-barrel